MTQIWAATNTWTGLAGLLLDISFGCKHVYSTSLTDSATVNVYLYLKIK